MKNIYGALAMALVLGFSEQALSVEITTVQTIAPKHELEFRLHGIPQSRISADLLKSLLKQEKMVKVYEPHMGVEREYVGFEMSLILEKMYGADLNKAEEVLFTCVDGYQPSIPLSRFKKFTAYLVYKLKNGSEFVVDNKAQGEKKVQLGPYYLVWDNIKHPELRDLAPDTWPYQIAKIDLVNFEQRFSKMSPFKKSSPQVKRGFLAFRQHCMNCHAINGEGGQKGFELNYPVSVTEMFKEEWLRKWILNPTSIRYNTTMPALPLRDEFYKDQGQLLNDIVAYLKAMSKLKRDPLAKAKK